MLHFRLLKPPHSRACLTPAQADVKRNEAGEPDEGKSEVDFDSDNAAHMTWVWR